MNSNIIEYKEDSTNFNMSINKKNNKTSSNPYLEFNN